MSCECGVYSMQGGNAMENRQDACFADGDACEVKHGPAVHLKLLATIVDRGKGQSVTDLMKKEGVLFHTIMLGRGTARKAVLNYLGLGETEKDVVISTIRMEGGRHVLKKLMQAMQLDAPGRGIAFTVPLSSVGGAQTLSYLTGIEHMGPEKDMASKYEVNDMDNHEHSLVITIVNRGFSDQVVDAALRAGARGGTVLHGRGAGLKEAEKFFGITIQPEKEVVLILVRREQKLAAMQEICKSAGLSTPGHGFSFSLPVDDVLGMAPMIMEEMNEEE